MMKLGLFLAVPTSYCVLARSRAWASDANANLRQYRSSAPQTASARCSLVFQRRQQLGRSARRSRDVEWRTAVAMRIEPLTCSGRFAAGDNHIGLISTATTIYSIHSTWRRISRRSTR